MRPPTPQPRILFKHVCTEGKWTLRRLLSSAVEQRRGASGEAWLRPVGGGPAPVKLQAETITEFVAKHL